MQAFLKPRVPKENDKMEVEEAAKPNALMPWVEKYRPSKLSELASQTEVVNAFEAIAKNGNLPHILLYGPAGTGKTSSVLALARQLFGPHLYRERVFEMNASDDRGIKAVREKVKKFAMNAISKNVDKYIGHQFRKYLCPNYKIIILDEADSMTTEAQSALRRIIEDFSERTRFVIICNYITRIIEPLTSRCVKFRFRPVPMDDQIAKLEEICQKENIKIGRNIIESLLSQGDLRKSINSLQSLHNVSTVPEILPLPQEVCTELFETLRHSNNLGEVLRKTNETLRQGWPSDELLKGLLKQATVMEDNRKMSMIFEVLARADFNVNRRGSQVQIVAAVSDIFYILHSP